MIITESENSLKIEYTKEEEKQIDVFIQTLKGEQIIVDCVSSKNNI